jgi:hypothetical protein
MDEEGAKRGRGKKMKGDKEPLKAPDVQTLKTALLGHMANQPII